MQMPLSLKWTESRSWTGSRHKRWTSRRAIGFGILGLLVSSLAVWSAVKRLGWLAIGWALLMANSQRLGLFLTEMTIPAIEITTVTSLGFLVIWSIQIRRSEQLSNEYAQAIEQLQNDKLENRLEGVHALGRIAKVMRKEHGAVTQTLASFIQARSPLYCLTATDPMQPTEPTDRPLQEPQTIASDVQAALTIIGQKPDSQGLVAHLRSLLFGQSLIPKRKALSTINMGLTNLGKIRLHNAHLEDIDLYKANLQASNLYRANLKQTNLQAANLQQANLYRANLQKAALQHGQLQQAFLPEADLQQSNLYSANLQQADLQCANLRQTGLQNANLQQANLQGASLQEAFLSEANLQSANLTDADLQGAFLYQTNLHNANLHNANLHHANLQSAIGLTQQQLQHAQLCRTLLPDGSISYRDCAVFV